MSEEVVPTEEQKLEKIPNCSQHETEQIRFWCETCDEKLCNTCFENDHEGHNIQSMKNFLKKQIETYNTEISDLSSGLDKMIVKCQEHIDACEEFKKSLAAEKEDVEKVSKDLEKAGQSDDFNLPLAYQLWTKKNSVVNSAQGSLEEADSKISKYVRLEFQCQLFFTGGRWRGGTFLRHGRNIFRVDAQQETSFSGYSGGENPLSKEHCNCGDLSLEISWGDEYINDKDFEMKGEITIEGESRRRRIEFEGSCKNWRRIVVKKNIPVHDADSGNLMKELVPGKYGLDLAIELNFFDR